VHAAWGGPPIDSAANLLKDHVTSVTTDGTMLFESRLENIHDGVLISNGGVAENTGNLARFSAGSKIVFQLDGAYDVGRIDVFTVHCQRNGQKFNLDISRDGGASWVPLCQISYDHVAGDWQVYRSRIRVIGGAALAQGVNALRFTMAVPDGQPPYDTYDSVFGEIAAYAVPKAPGAGNNKR